MKKGILLVLTLIWMGAVGIARADQPVKKTAHLTRAQFQEKIKAQRSSETKATREVGGAADRGAPQVSPFVEKKKGG